MKKKEKIKILWCCFLFFKITYTDEKNLENFIFKDYQYVVLYEEIIIKKIHLLTENEKEKLGLYYSQFLQSEIKSQQLNAIFLLGCFRKNGKNYIPILIPFLQNEDLLIQYESAISLNYINPSPDPLLIPILIKGLQSSIFFPDYRVSNAW